MYFFWVAGIQIDGLMKRKKRIMNVKCPFCGADFRAIGVSGDNLFKCGTRAGQLPSIQGEMCKMVCDERSLRIAAEKRLAKIQTVIDDPKYGLDPFWVVANIRAMYLSSRHDQHQEESLR